MAHSYKDAGVNIDEADRAVAEIRKMARATFTKGVLTDIGSFGGCFALPNMAKMKQPVPFKVQSTAVGMC